MSFTIKLIMVMKVQINFKPTKELQEPIISSVLLFPSYLSSTKLSLISGLRTDHKSMLSESFNTVPPYHGGMPNGATFCNLNFYKFNLAELLNMSIILEV